MVSQHKGTGKGQPQSSRSRSRSRPAKRSITLERKSPPLSPYEQLLKKHNLKLSDILSRRDIGTELILVTKNGMKIRVKKQRN